MHVYVVYCHSLILLHSHKRSLIQNCVHVLTIHTNINLLSFIQVYNYRDCVYISLSEQIHTNVVV